MTYGYFTADISTGVTYAHSTRPSPGCASSVHRRELPICSGGRFSHFSTSKDSKIFNQ